MEHVKVYVVTFNCGRELIRPDVFASHISSVLSSPQPPDLVLFCLQEIAPIAYAFLGGSYLLPYFNQVRRAVTFATAKDETEGPNYVNFHTDNVGMTALLAFAKAEQLEDRIRWIETAGVGVGLYDMGNKGAVGLRIGWGVGEDVVQITAVSAHLAPMEEALKRRNSDWRGIVERLVFSGGESRSTGAWRRKSSEDDEHDDSVRGPLLEATDGHGWNPGTGMFSPASHLIFSGDLNYRTAPKTPSPLDYKDFPRLADQPGSSHHFSSLLAKDQLAREMRAQRTCHGLREAGINFPPTYKYSLKARLAAGNRTSDTVEMPWAKHRWPSWCDRILYLDCPSWMKSEHSSFAVEASNYIALPLMETSDHRPVTMELRIPAVPLKSPAFEDLGSEDIRCNPPFGLAPDWRYRRAAGRMGEIVVGVGAFLLLTWEGRGALIAMILGALGAWWVVVSML